MPGRTTKSPARTGQKGVYDYMSIIPHSGDIFKHIPASHIPMATALFRVVQESGLDDPFDVAAAVYRWTEVRPACRPIRDGLERFFRGEV